MPPASGSWGPGQPRGTSLTSLGQFGTSSATPGRWSGRLELATAFANLAACGQPWHGGGGRFCPHSWGRNIGHLPLSFLGTGAPAVAWCPQLSTSLKEGRRRVSDPQTRSPTWALSCPKRPTRLLEEQVKAWQGPHASLARVWEKRKQELSCSQAGVRGKSLLSGPGPHPGSGAGSRALPAGRMICLLSERLRLPQVFPGGPSPSCTPAHRPGSWGCGFRAFWK